MKLDAHIGKAERIERSLAKCSPHDFEAVIEGAMLAGTHWFNVLLHRNGLREPDKDAMHAEFITAGERRKLTVAIPEALDALDRIEHLRTTHVRGDMPDGEAAAAQALACLDRLRESAKAR
jgi:hypothetical protein